MLRFTLLGALFVSNFALFIDSYTSVPGNRFSASYLLVYTLMGSFSQLNCLVLSSLTFFLYYIYIFFSCTFALLTLCSGRHLSVVFTCSIHCGVPRNSPRPWVGLSVIQFC